MDLIMDIAYVLFIIVMIYLTFTICLLYVSTLTITRDINDTSLGKSIVGNVYETVKPISLKFSIYEKKELYLAEYEEIPSLLNPEQWSYIVKIPSGIKFKIINVKEKTGMAYGTHLNTTITLLDNIPIHSILEYMEADIPEGSSYTEYIKKDIMKSKNPYLNKIFDKHFGFKTKKLILELFSFVFFKYKTKDITNRKPIKHNKTIIKRIK